MSRCDIRITFDDNSRRFRGGEIVSGKVHVIVNSDIRSNGIVLTHYWKTHGRGNTDRGPKTKLQLANMASLVAGEELHLPFEFKAERWPLTYHGHYINVDHYVHVAVDVPWAIDPKHEEDFILTAGMPPEEFSADRSAAVDMNSGVVTEAGSCTKTLLGGILGVVLLALGTLFFFLIPVFVILGGCVWAWKKAIASRVGDVKLDIPHVQIGPGDPWPLRLHFTPKKTFRINGMTVQIISMESATSGSGTNSTTYRHTLFDQTFQLHPGGVLLAGEEVTEDFHADFPDSAAWSFKKSDNKITWHAKVRIDIPRFPDWKKTVELQLLPVEFFQQTRTEDALLPADLSAPKAVPEHPRETSPDVSLEPAYKSDNAPQFQQSSTVSSNSIAPLLRLIDEISNANRFGNERSEIVNQSDGHRYDVQIMVDRTASTYGFTGDDQALANGKTVIGRIVDSDQTVQLFCRETGNDRLDSLSRGDTFLAVASVHSWDSLYNRLVMHEVAP